ncbi:MAG: carboxypeptidase regulatory-like domain-containing protein, partial [Acidobacteriota bacterium]
MHGSPTSGTAPLTVSFGGSATGGKPPYTYSWAFGDGSTSASQNPSHTYTGTGTYAAVLTVTDSASQAGQAAVKITVTTAATYSISGTVTMTACSLPLAGVTVSAGSGTAGTTDSNGNYTISGLPNGTYTITASLVSYTISPYNFSNPVTISGGNKTGNALAAQGPYIISGTITSSTQMNYVAMKLSWPGTVPSCTSFTTGQGSSLAYNIVNLGYGTYTITPVLDGFSFTPASQTVTIDTQGNKTQVNFTATTPGHNINGQLQNNSSTATFYGNVVQVTASGPNGTYMAGSLGNAGPGQSLTYTISGVPDGTYTVTPSSTEPCPLLTFTPTSLSGVMVAGADKTVTTKIGVGINTRCLSGTVRATDGTGVQGVTIQADGNQSAVTDATGAYVISGLSNGSHRVHPSAQDRQRYLFSPDSRTPVLSDDAPLAHQDFTATPKSGAAAESTTAEDPGGASGDSPQA